MNWEQFTWLLLDNADKYFLIAGPVFFIFYIGGLKFSGVKVGYCAGETTEAASEMGATLLLATARRIPEAMELSRHPSNLYLLLEFS